MAIKIVITPKNLAESTLSFNLGTKGKLITGINNEQEDEHGYNEDSYGYRSIQRSSYYNRDYYTRSEGTFNMTASVMVIKVVKPTRGGGPK